jgi:multidrug efflux pump subunit AcrB
LYKYAKKVQDELEKNSLISEVTISGWEESEFMIKIDPKKLETYWLSIDQVNKSIQAYNFTFPIWEYDVWNFTHFLNIDERFYDTSILRDLVITKIWDSSIVYLKDIATIQETWKKKTSISRVSDKWSDPKNAVNLWVIKKRGWSIVDLVDQWIISLDNLKSMWIIPSDLKITTIIDLSERIKLDLSHLIRDWLITVSLVFLTLFLSSSLINSSSLVIICFRCPTWVTASEIALLWNPILSLAFFENFDFSSKEYLLSVLSSFLKPTFPPWFFNFW